MPKRNIKTPLFVAIDTADIKRARALALAIAPVTHAIKLGLEFFVHHGPDGVRHVLDGLDVALFLDLKLHDIPNTVAGAVRSTCVLQPRFITVHTAGGESMMQTARETAEEEAKKLKITRPQILGVTVLTSLNDGDLKAMGHLTPTADQVRRLALLAQDCNLDGLVCSPHELRELRTLCGDAMQLVCPGIRPVGSKTDDQKRTLTPAEAMASGANYMVMGRPITGADDPAKAARDVLASLK
jgi:orotidine-5'-phosphate decarboxylase